MLKDASTVDSAPAQRKIKSTKTVGRFSSARPFTVNTKDNSPWVRFWPGYESTLVPPRRLRRCASTLERWGRTAGEMGRAEAA